MNDNINDGFNVMVNKVGNITSLVYSCKYLRVCPGSSLFFFVYAKGAVSWLSSTHSLWQLTSSYVFLLKSGDHYLILKFPHLIISIVAISILIMDDHINYVLKRLAYFKTSLRNRMLRQGAPYTGIVKSYTEQLVYLYKGKNFKCIRAYKIIG